MRALAKDLADDPGILIPECAGECSKCHFDKLHAKLKKIQGYRDNPDVLRKFASGGKQIERAYAAMLILAQENTPIMFANAKLPTGDVSFTVRGKAKKEFLIGIQHFDDPRIRLLAYSELALKKKLNLYSFKDGLLCTGRTAKYPLDLLSEVLDSSNYALVKDQHGYTCGHDGNGYGMQLEIISADREISICRSCTSEKANLFTLLTSRVLARNPDDDFRITMEHDVKCVQGDECTLAKSPIKKSEMLARYRKGALSDRSLMDEYGREVRAALVQANKPIFVLGNVCYEGDYAAFIKAIHPTDIEEAALKRILKSAQTPVVMDTATPNAVLALFWEKHGANAIHAVTGDKDLARKVFSESRESGKTPAQILRDASAQSKSKTALASLPNFSKLGRLGKYTDELSRTFRAQGKEETLRRIGTVQDGTKEKSVNCGFLIALDSLKGKEWQFTKEEQDYGRYLADFVKILLEAPPEKYTDALQNLLTASGSNESVG